MKILIKGAGDLATGIASRLYGAGHQILMTEIAEPLTVRRTVALSRAVYEGCAEVEEMRAFRADSQEEAGEVLSRGDIPVMVDAAAQCRRWYEPDVVVDAILAKKNLGTEITDAPFVIGETKRGHTLGNVIWQGSAIPNTGVPGNVGGYTIERLIRASAAGKIEPRAKIGDYVEAGQVVALTGGEPVYARMSGIVRGMLQEGADVTENLKIGDIDARAEISHCYTISDKARAIGGGVLEAVDRFALMQGRYAIVILAAGAGTRFGGDKLRALVRGKPLYEHMLDKAKVFSSFPSFIVTGDEQIAKAAEKRGITAVQNREPERGIALSLCLGLEAARKAFADPGREDRLRGILFTVCDQPGIETATMQRIFNTGILHPGSIVCAGRSGRTGNPVLWDRRYFPGLAELTGDVGGRQIMDSHREQIRIVETEAEELIDVDRREDLRSL